MKTIHRSLAAGLSVTCLIFTTGWETGIKGSGKMATETRQVSGFSGVQLAALGDLIILQGDTEGLVIDAEDNILPEIETKVDADGTLRLDFRHNVSPTRPVTFHLSAKIMDTISLAGSGSVHAEKIIAKHEAIALPGSGKISVGNLETPDLSVTLGGSGTVKVGHGAAPNQEVHLGGSGSYDGQGLKSDAVKVSIGGSGECKVWAEKTLDARIGGSGEVGYRGTPEVHKSVSGSGEVHALDSKTS